MHSNSTTRAIPFAVVQCADVLNASLLVTLGYLEAKEPRGFPVKVDLTSVLLGLELPIEEVVRVAELNWTRGTIGTEHKVVTLGNTTVLII